MSDAAERPRLKIEFKTVERKAPTPAHGDAFCVNFVAWDDYRRFTIPVWVYDGECRPSDVVRVAMHRLHLDLQDLAKQTESLRLSEQDYRELVPTD